MNVKYRKSTINDNGYVKIHAKLKSGQYASFGQTRLSCHESMFDYVISGRHTKKTAITPESAETRKQFAALDHRLTAQLNALPSKPSDTRLLQNLINRYFQESSTMLLPYIDNFIEKSGERQNTKTGTAIKSGTITQYKELRKQVASFYTGKRRGDVEINGLNKTFIDDFTAYLSLKYAFNTVNKHLSNLKAVINRAIEDEIRTKPLKISVHYVENEKVYLKQEELQALINTDVPKLQRVKNTFLLLIYTGQRKSDYRQIINPDNRTGDRILITQQKTGIPLCIPIHPAARQILNSGVFLKEIHSNFGMRIQKLCEIAGINEKINITKTVKGKQITEIKPKYELITPHTARRTFVSIHKQQGFTNSQIMSITGHKSLQTLESYDKTTQREYADSVMEEWNREFIKPQPRMI